MSLLLVGFLVAGCGGNAQSVDAAGIDLAPLAGCGSDPECGGATPRCDQNTRTCVACLPQRDDCPAGSHCQVGPSGNACRTDCASSLECPKTDGGVASQCCTGACLDISTDPQNCGGCGARCPVIQRGLPSCVAGACGIGLCSRGYADCDQNSATGCETSVSDDVRNCGACGTVCPGGPNAQPSCRGGVCSLNCNNGYAHCSKNPADGCEAPTGGDPNNCGACGVVCGALGNATSTCSAGACVIASCPAGTSDCNRLALDGCEVSTASDALNCGSCGRVCGPYANAIPVCKGGACALASCSALFGDCNALVADGCERSLAADVANCGVCGKRCVAANAIPSCAAGACGLSACNPGWGNCDNSAVNGCEVNTNTDPANCGKCGNQCPKNLPQCAGGVCTVITYSDAFFQGVTPVAQCTDWAAFQARLTGSYTSITIKGSFDNVGITCAGAGANTLCQALHNSTPVAVMCGGRLWNVGAVNGCGPGVELALDAACSCNTNYVVRPCIGNASWGGVNSATCNAPSQTMTVICQ